MSDLYAAPIDKVKDGSVLECDDGFTCLHDEDIVVVRKDENGLYVVCDEGRHYIDGQLDWDDCTTYVGFKLIR